MGLWYTMVTLPLFFYQNFHPKCNVYANVVVFFLFISANFYFSIVFGYGKVRCNKNEFKQRKNKNKIK